MALLRAVNVGGTAKLPMSELKAMCCEAGLARVETYIASGNAVFDSKASPSRAKAELLELAGALRLVDAERVHLDLGMARMLEATLRRDRNRYFVGGD